MLFRDLLYLLVLAVLSPWLIWRAIRTGRYRRDLGAKLLGSAPMLRTGGPVAWFHGVSVGEIHLLVTVIAAFRKRRPEFAVVVSSTTDTGLAEARAKFAGCTVLAFPFDFSWAVRNALDAIRPTVVILAESEMWPNFLAAAAERHIPVVVINARMSPRSFARLSRVAGLARSLLFRHVTAFAVQSEDYAARLRQLGVSEGKLTVTGSVKFDGATGDRDTPKARELDRLLRPEAGPHPVAARPPSPSETVLSENGGRGSKKDNDDTPSVLGPPLPPTPEVSASEGEGLGVRAFRGLTLVAGSTHAPEEEIVLRAFAELRPKHPALRLILVPRHPDRFEEVAKLLEASGVPFARRSRLSDPPADPPPVLLLDTVGELGAAWSLADVGFTGGSLDGKRGGQSMIEPAGYGVPVVFGPHIWNFRDAAKRLVEVGGAVMVKTAEELAPALDRLLADRELRARMGHIARQFVLDNQGATEKTLDVIDRVLADPTPSRNLPNRAVPLA